MIKLQDSEDGRGVFILLGFSRFVDLKQNKQCYSPKSPFHEIRLQKRYSFDTSHHGLLRTFLHIKQPFQNMTI